MAQASTTAKNGPKTAAFEEQKGKGRPKGVQNKVTKQIKEMIIGALDEAGGQAYLVKQANENPVAFMGLVGKVIPLQIANEEGEAFKVIHQIDLVAVAPGEGAA